MVLPHWKTRAAVDITRADVRILLANVAKTRGGVFLRLRLLTAQRSSTVTRMKWAHVDLDRAVWSGLFFN